MSEKEKSKGFSKYFGGEYMKYWYIAFAITTIIMFAVMVNNRNIKEYKYTVYNNDGTVQKVETLSPAEVQLRQASPEMKSIEPVKMF